MTHLSCIPRLAWLTAGALLVAPNLGAQNFPDGLENQYVQHLGLDASGASTAASIIPCIETGYFLPGDDRMGALVLRESGGVTKLQYLDSLAIWNTADLYHVELGTVDAAVLRGAGPGGLDAVASIVDFGLTVHEANAAGDGFSAVSALLGWFLLERVFAVDLGNGVYEIHGYDAGSNTMQRASYNSATKALTSLASYTAPAGLLGMTTFECDASAGRELVFWTDQGDLIIKNASATTTIITHTEPLAAGEFRAAEVLDTSASSDELLVWNFRSVSNGKENLRVLSSTAPFNATDINLGFVPEPRSMAGADWNGDGIEDLVLGLSLSSGPGKVWILRRWDTGIGFHLNNPTLSPLFDLVEGDYYTNSQADLLATGDVDGDGDVDVFAAGEALGSIQHLLSDEALSMRPIHDYNTLEEKSGVLSGSFEITLPEGYVYSAGQQLRVRIYPKVAGFDTFDVDESQTKLFSLSSSTVANEKLLFDVGSIVNFPGVPGWSASNFTILVHTALVEVSGGSVTQVKATALSSIFRGDSEKDDLEELKSRQELGDNPTGSSGLVGDGDTSTGRPPGGPPGGGDPPPGSTGGG